MTDMERAQIKEKIADSIKKVEADIVRLKESTQPISPDNAIGRVSRMDAINNKSVNEAGLRSAEIKLGKLEVAITRVDTPEFGVCTRCGNDIQMGRLFFMPESSLCISCARRR